MAINFYDVSMYRTKQHWYDVMHQRQHARTKPVTQTYILYVYILQREPTQKKTMKTTTHETGTNFK